MVKMDWFIMEYCDSSHFIVTYFRMERETVSATETPYKEKNNTGLTAVTVIKQSVTEHLEQ